LKSEKLGLLEKRVQYVINGKHRFEFAISASIEPVRIDVLQKSFSFFFKEDSKSLETTEILKLTNFGNATAHFKWNLSEQKVFLVSCEEGDLAAGKS